MHRKQPSSHSLRRRVRWLVGIFMGGLVLSGITAIPLERELDCLVEWLRLENRAPDTLTAPAAQWLLRVQAAVHHTQARYPFVAYGLDWLAFGHFVVALAFVGAWRDPVRNRWLFDFGLLACSLVVPYALIFGAARGIPLWWQAVDSSFGILGAIPLWLARRATRQLAALNAG